MIDSFEALNFSKSAMLASVFLLKNTDLKVSVIDISKAINMTRGPLYNDLKLIRNELKFIDDKNRSMAGTSYLSQTGFEVVPALSHLHQLSRKSLLLFLKILFYRDKKGYLKHYKTGTYVNMRYFSEAFNIPYSELRRLTRQIQHAELLCKKQTKHGYIWRVGIPHFITSKKSKCIAFT